MIVELVIGGGIIVAVIAAIRYYLAQKDGEKVETVYVDELRIGEIKTWFADKITQSTLKGVILYPTPENLAKWKLDVDTSQQENLLIQAVYDEGKEKIVNYREVVFGTLSAKLQEMLDTNGGAIVIES